MKNILFLFLIIIFANIVIAQVPQSFKYQTVVRNSEGKALANTLVGLRFSILFGSPLGSTVYSETFQHATNEAGVASVNIGMGTAIQGVFATINWAAGDYFLKTEIDITGSTNYIFIGTSQLLAVPIALYAETAGRSINDQDTSSTNEIQNLSKAGNTITLSLGGGSVTDSDNQTLSINNHDLSISNGNTVTLPFDADHDTLNEIQNISKSGNIITLSKNGGSITDSDNQTLSTNHNQITISNGNTISIDTDTLNEIQTLSKNGNIVTLSKNGGSYTDSDNQTITLSGNQLSISNGNTIVLSGAVDLDNDPLNEIQSLSLSHDTLRISLANEIILPHDYDRDSLNEIQSLHLSNDTLYLTKSNNAILPYVPITNNGIVIGFSNTCSMTNKGMLRYNDNVHMMQYCTGTYWENVSVIPNDLHSNIVVKNCTQAGLNNGALKVNITDGFPPYTINWSNGNHSDSISNLNEGIYTVTVFDSNQFFVSNTTTLSHDSITIDRDGNSYDIVNIGSQQWLKQDLKTTKYCDGSVIPHIADIATWADLTTGALCYYNNDSITNAIVYGALYNWHAISDSRKICPFGWHVPTNSEWLILEKYLDSSVDTTIINSWTGTDVGGKMKETGWLHWNTPNTGANNVSGFNALPAGHRFPNGGFNYINNNADWWTANVVDSLNAKELGLINTNSQVNNGQINKRYGLSVRCIRD